MTKSQKLAIEQSKTRQKLNELLGNDELSTEQRAELDTLSERAQELEIEFRAAVCAEGETEVKTEVRTEEDAEAKELRDLETRATVSEFVSAGMAGRAVRGASLEFSQAVGADGRFPLRLLAPEPERRATTDTDAGVTQNTWLDRLFDDAAATRLGVTMRSVASGVAAFPVTTAGATGAQRGRSEAAAASNWTVGVTDIKPSRNAVRAIFSREDAARLPALEEALRRDLSMALMDAIDKAIFVGDSGANEDPGDITGLTAAAITESTLTQANKLKGQQTLALFAAMIDGRHATSMEDLNVVTAVGANTLWLSTVINTGQAGGQPLTLAQFLQASKLGWSARGGIEANTAAGDFAAFVGRSRGIEGAAVAAVWEAADLIRDPYSEAAKGEVALTLSYLWGFKLPRTSNFRRLKFVA